MTDVALFHIDDDSVVRFSLANISRTLTGPEEAVQLVAYAMFTTPGSCVFALQDGGGVLELRNKNVSDAQQLRADAAVIVRRSMETVRRAQRPGRAANATVTSLELIDAWGDHDSGRIRIKVRIRLQDGNSFSVKFEGAQ